MIGVYTMLVDTFMVKVLLRFCQWLSSNFNPCKPMCWAITTIPPKLPMPVRINEACPQPTTIGNFNLGPKPLNVRINQPQPSLNCASLFHG